MINKETLGNKICSLVLIGLGIGSIFIDMDATACVLLCAIGIPLFFEKENVIG